MADLSPTQHSQVGAPDPDRTTSPILGEEDELEFEPSGTGGVCYFNGVAFAPGSYVQSGSEVLRCEAPGVWVREGELKPRSRVTE